MNAISFITLPHHRAMLLLLSSFVHLCPCVSSARSRWVITGGVTCTGAIRLNCALTQTRVTRPLSLRNDIQRLYQPLINVLPAMVCTIQLLTRSSLHRQRRRHAVNQPHTSP
jgi:hypothetical protein